MLLCSTFSKALHVLDAALTTTYFPHTVDWKSLRLRDNSLTKGQRVKMQDLNLESWVTAHSLNHHSALALCLLREFSALNQFSKHIPSAVWNYALPSATSPKCQYLPSCTQAWGKTWITNPNPFLRHLGKTQWPNPEQLQASPPQRPSEAFCTQQQKSPIVNSTGKSFLVDRR